jgi:hypothetical protein
MCMLSSEFMKHLNMICKYDIVLINVEQNTEMLLGLQENAFPV